MIDLVLRFEVKKRDHATRLVAVEFDRSARAGPATAVAASRIRTTRSPARPSAIGVPPVSMQATNSRISLRQRLGDIEMRRPHVAGPIADHAPDSLSPCVRRLAVKRDALVVDLDLFARLEIVVDDHLLAAADQRAAHLDRRQPVDVDVGDQVALEVQRQIGDVLRLAGDVAHARRGDGHRPLRQDIVHDGQIVDGEVPDDADIVLEQAEIHADRVVIVDVAEAGLDEFAHLANGAACGRRCGRRPAPDAASPPRRPGARPLRVDDAIGFSTKTCLPAISAFIARRKCDETGVAIATASIAGSRRISSKSSVISTAGYAP